MTCLCDFKSLYYENYNHENSYHEDLKIYINIEHHELTN